MDLGFKVANFLGLLVSVEFMNNGLGFLYVVPIHSAPTKAAHYKFRGNCLVMFVLPQVGHLGEAYQEWVHQPIISKERPRFFKSDFWEVTN